MSTANKMKISKLLDYERFCSQIIILLVVVSLFFVPNSAFADIIGPEQMIWGYIFVISIIVVPIAIVYLGIVILRSYKPSLRNYIHSNRFIVIGLFFLAEGISWIFFRIIVFKSSSILEDFGSYFPDYIILVVIPGIILIAIGVIKNRSSKISRLIVIIFLIVGSGIVIFGPTIIDDTLGISLPSLAEIERLTFCNEIRAMENMDKQYNIDDGCDLAGADLRGAKLYSADLRGAKLSGADLSGADLNSAILIDADLSGADLRGATFYRANIDGVDLSGADLSGAHLIEANLIAADLSGTRLAGTFLSGAKLYRANITGVDLSGVDLRGAILIEADLSGADLRGADLSGARLTGANLTGAKLYRANIDGTDLSGADLSGAIFTDAINQRGGNIDCKGEPIDAAFTCIGEPEPEIVEEEIEETVEEEVVLLDVIGYTSPINPGDVLVIIGTGNPGGTVTGKIIDSEGNVLNEIPIPVNFQGKWSYETKISLDAPLGKYTVEFMEGNNGYIVYVTVES